MRLRLDLKKTIENTPATLIKKPFVLFFCCKQGEFPVHYLYENLVQQKKLSGNIYDIQKKDIIHFINNELDKGFFSEPSINFIKGFDTLKKKERERFLVYLKSDIKDSFIFYLPSSKYSLFKTLINDFFNICVFDDNISWMTKSYIKDIFDDFCGEIDDEVLRFVYDKINGKDIMYLHNQIEKVALYFVGDSWENTSWRDHVSKALDIDSDDSFISTLRLLELILTGNHDSSINEFYSLAENMPANVINSNLITQLTRLIAFYEIFSNNGEFREILKEISTTGPIKYPQFNKIMSSIKKIQEFSMPEMNEQLLKRLNAYNLSSYKYLSDIVSIDRANKMLYTMLENDCKMKNGEVLSAEDSFLITVKEVIK